MKPASIPGKTAGTLDDAKAYYQMTLRYIHVYLTESGYFQQLSVHRYPREVKVRTLGDLSDWILNIQRLDCMRDVDFETNAAGYVTTVVGEIFLADRRVRSLLQAVQIYCVLRGKEVSAIAPTMARFRAYNILYKQINQSLRGERCRQQMGKRFWVKIRKADSSEPYLKVVFKEAVSFEGAKARLTGLEGIKSVNITYGAYEFPSITIRIVKGSIPQRVLERVDEALAAFLREGEGTNGGGKNCQRLIKTAFVCWISSSDLEQSWGRRSV